MLDVSNRSLSISTISENVTTWGATDNDLLGLSGNFMVNQVPEPSILAIFALSIMGLASCRFKKQ